MTKSYRSSLSRASFLLAFALAVRANSSPATEGETGKADAGAATKLAGGSTAAVGRELILEALIRARLPHPDRILIHCSHTCDLQIDGARFPVIDLRELVRNTNVPRGYNRIVVFRPDWTVFRQVEYIDERPLFCRGNELFVFGEMQASVASGSNHGNVLVFSEEVDDFRLRTVNVLTLPTLREQQRKETKSVP